MPAYIALIRREDGTDYWVDIPDLPGCVASGETPEAAMQHFEEALTLHMQALNPDSLPPPSPLATLMDETFTPPIEAYSVDVALAARGQLAVRFARLT